MRLVLAVAFVCLSVLSMGQVGSEIVDTSDPNIQRVIRQQEQLLKTGIVTIDDFRYDRPPSRFEMAVVIYATTLQVENSLRQIEKGSVGKQEEQRFKSQISAAFEAIAGLDWAASLFEYEVGVLGVKMKELQSRIKTIKVGLNRLFVMKNVPAGHWAAASVAKLNELGILVGYPDGRFRG